ncbi:ribonuclease H-like domain-containing protein, partial [Fomitopsis serialis]|uniref:ribonuclease H-like domain-containing protein n=1 Tax=Fomitopsis serialis TaxID=139415 RepID=UPI002007919C
KKPGFYAVAKGHNPGVYLTWDECSPQVMGFPGSTYKKFTNAAEAEAWVASAAEGSSAAHTSAPASSRSLTAAATRASSSTTARTIAKLPSSPPSPAKPRSSTKPVSASAEPVAKRKRSLAGQPVEDESGWLIVYSDGACKGNGKVGSVAGVGVWWGQKRCPGVQTNNRAELIAIVRVLETAPHDKRQLLIKTDSQYSINCFQTWLPGWIAKGWRNSKGEPVKNRQLIQYLSALLDQRALEGQKVRLQYVRGHAGEEGNEGADFLANVGVTRPELAERNWDALRLSVQSAPVVDPDRIMFAAPEVIVPPEAKKEFTESSQKLFSADVDAPISSAELEAYASGLVEDDDLLWDLEDDI